MASAAEWLGLRPPDLSYLWDYALASGWLEFDEEPDGGRGRAVNRPDRLALGGRR